MAFNVIFYNFKKVKNSTELPSGGTTFNCQLKEKSTIINPIIVLSIGIEAPYTSNYAYIPTFGRYYFVKDWESDGLLWSAYLTVDPMASFKSVIGASTQYILRSSREYDDNIVDSAYPTTGGYIETLRFMPLPGSATGYQPWKRFINRYEMGIYIVGIINDETEGKIGGALSYYALDHSAFKQMMNSILQNVDWLNVNQAEISPELLKVLVEPLQYVKSLLWMPLSLEQLTDNVGNLVNIIKFGFWEASVPAGAYVMTDGVYKMAADITIPKHPQVESEFSYLNLSPYSKLTLKFPPYSDIELDPLQLYAINTVQLRIIIDLITGESKLNVIRHGEPNDIILTSVGCSVAVPMDIGDVFRGFDKTVKGGIVGAIQSVMDHPILGMAGDPDAISKIRDSASAGGGMSLYSGSVGTICGYWDDPCLIAEFLEQVPINNNTMGKPLCKKRTVSSLPGFMICQNPKVKMDAFDSEIDIVHNYMANGFYYE